VNGLDGGCDCWGFDGAWLGVCGVVVSTLWDLAVFVGYEFVGFNGIWEVVWLVAAMMLSLMRIDN